MKARFIDVDGVRTRVLFEGAGPPLLLVHGVGVSADIFIRNIDVLAESFTVYAPDILGHGFTDRASFENEAPQVVAARHLSRVMEQLGATSYSALGSSYGGLIAALLCFLPQAKVSDLIIVGSGSVFHPPDEQVKTLRAAAANGSRAYSEASIDACRKRLQNLCYDPQTVPEEILPVQASCYAMPDRLPAYQEAIEGTIAHMLELETRVFDCLEELTTRTLVITGKQDIRSSVDWTQKGVARMPNAQLTVLDECGHLPFLEHPDKFNDLVRSYLLPARDRD